MEACEAPLRLLLLTREPDQSEDQSIEVTLTGGGGQTTVVWEERGMPVAYLAGYGAGIQVHVEDLGPTSRGAIAATPVRGARMAQLFPVYEPVAAKVSWPPPAWEKGVGEMTTKRDRYATTHRADAARDNNQDHGVPAHRPAP